jgi:hypothetical protein
MATNAERQEAWREAHPELNRKRNQASYRKRKLRNREWVEKYLRSHPCESCGENDILVLGFEYGDHEGTTVSNPIASFGLKRLKEEVVKCSVACANCHQRYRAQAKRWH